MFYGAHINAGPIVSLFAFSIEIVVLLYRYDTGTIFPLKAVFLSGHAKVPKSQVLLYMYTTQLLFI
jgi:hypothetical protein